nr:hypothetical protein [Tanacetum cinerariifolium]
MTTLADHMIVAGADNHPSMLENTMYNSWQSRMLLYIKGKDHVRMMLKSVLKGPLVYLTIEVDGVTRLMTYEELLDKEKLQDDYHMIVAGADNHPSMLESTMYNSWQSRMLLYIKGKEHVRMVLKSVLKGPLVYPTIEVDGVTILMTYEELLDKEKLQDDCDLHAMNIVLQCLPPYIYALVNYNQVAKQI